MQHHIDRLLFLAILAAPVHAQCTLVSSPGGSGCGTSTPFGIPTITCSGLPQIGNQGFGVTANVPCTSPAATLLVGECRSTPLVIRAPFGPGGFCGPTEAVCALFIDPLASVSVPGLPRVGGFTFPIPVPNDPRLVGVRVCAQEANLCAIQGWFCIGASQAIAITLR